MTKPDCKTVCVAAMAMADGYVSELSADQIEKHLAQCADCRQEVQQLRELTALLDNHQRQLRTENLWNRIEQCLPNALPAKRSSQARYPFVLLGLLLLGYRLVEMVPDRHLGFLIKVVPILLVIAAFCYLRENPFKINAELRLEGEAR
jgi:hypothetical protein